MGHPNRSVEDSATESNVDGRVPTEGTTISKCLEAIAIFWQVLYVLVLKICLRLR